MPRVLMVSPHFPPDTSAGAHRVRLLAPHLPACGWEPTVVTVDPRYYEGRLDCEISDLVPKWLRVVRSRAWPARNTRAFGFGDLGLRAFAGLLDTCSELLRSESFDALFITIYPAYTALLGPVLKRRFRVPFIVDYQDPWVGAWGKSVGGGPNGRPDLKSRLSRIAARALEPRALDGVDAITAVSAGTYEQLLARYPSLWRVPCREIPLGGEPADFELLRTRPRRNAFFDPDDGNVHLCYVGTLLPMGFETLRAFFVAVARLRDRDPDLYSRLRIRFFGTSNQTVADAAQRALPIAEELGIGGCVTEVAPRLDYLDALQVQVQASAILLMGSSEPHYTASKLYPALLAERPILAIYHEASTVVEILRSVAKSTAHVVLYGDRNRAESRVDAIHGELKQLLIRPVYEDNRVVTDAVRNYTANSLAHRLAELMDEASRLSHREPRRHDRRFRHLE
jgi:hypothetical protein